MPPGVKHPNYVCWDDLDATSRAYFIAFRQTSEQDRFQKAKAGISP